MLFVFKIIACLFLFVSCESERRSEQTPFPEKVKRGIPNEAISWKSSFIEISRSTIKSGSQTKLNFEIFGVDRLPMDLSLKELKVELSSGLGLSSVKMGTLKRIGEGKYGARIRGIRAGLPLKIKASIRGIPLMKDLNLTVLPGPLKRIILKTGASLAAPSLYSQSLDDLGQLFVYARGYDAEGNDLGLQNVEWTLSSAAPAILSNNVGTSTNMRMVRSDFYSAFRLNAKLDQQDRDIVVQSPELRVASSILSIPDLARWYRTESLLTQIVDGEWVGDADGVDRRLFDMSSHAIHAYATGENRPSLKSNVFGELPSLFFCLNESNPEMCPGGDLEKDRLRISTNLQSENWPLTNSNNYYTSFTFYIVTKRDEVHQDALHVTSVQSMGQAHGFYFGFPSATSVALGVNGHNGNIKVEAQLGEFSTNVEIFKGVYSRGSGENDGSLRLYRLGDQTPIGELSGLNPTLVGNTQLYMQLGQTFGNQTGQLHLGDFILFSRVLESYESEVVEKYLLSKY